MEPEKSIEQEIAEIVRDVVVDELTRLQFPEIPSNIAVELKNPPKNEVQKVDLSGVEKSLKEGFQALLNKKEKEIPETDLTRLEMLTETMVERIGGIELPDNKDLIQAITDALTTRQDVDFEPLSEKLDGVVEAIKNIKVTGHGAIGPSKYSILDTTGKAINPSISATEGDTITKGNVIMGKDALNQAGFVGLTGQSRDQIKTTEQNSHLLKEILDQIKIMNLHLGILSDAHFDEDNIEE